MKRREFLHSAAVLAASAAMPSALFAAGHHPAGRAAERLADSADSAADRAADRPAANPAAHLGQTIYSAPAVPSILIARAAAASGDSVKIWRTPDELRAGVASGQFRVMMSPANVCAMLAAKGFGVGYVNFLTSGLTSVLSRGEAVGDLRDLRARKIIMPFKNDMPDIVLKTLAKHHGIEGLDITYAATPAEAMALFLAKREFGAALLPEPAASACWLKARAAGEQIARGFNSAELWREAFGVRLFQAGMIAREGYASAHASELKMFNDELMRALAWAQNDPAAAGKLGANVLNAPVAALEKAISHSNLCAVPASAAREEVLEFLGILHAFNPALVGGKRPQPGLFLL